MGSDLDIKCLFFIEYNFLLPALEASFGSNRKHGLAGLSALPAYSAVDITHFPCTGWGSH